MYAIQSFSVCDIYVWKHVQCIFVNLFFQLQRSYNRFLTFYTTQHNGRKLNWLYKLSKVSSCVNVCGCGCACVCVGVCLCAFACVGVGVMGSEWVTICTVRISQVHRYMTLCVIVDFKFIIFINTHTH